MSSLRPQDRASLCRFTLADGRRCRTPRSGSHPHFCFYHARKESQGQTADKLGRDLSYFFSGDYVSACDLSIGLGRILAAVARGDIKPKTANTLAYLAQTLVQTLHIAEGEYINAFGSDGWRRAVRNSVNQNSDYRNPPSSDEPEESPAQPSAWPPVQPPAQPHASAPATLHTAAPPPPVQSDQKPLQSTAPTGHVDTDQSNNPAQGKPTNPQPLPNRPDDPSPAVRFT